jgi:hypothetical protein
MTNRFPAAPLRAGVSLTKLGCSSALACATDRQAVRITDGVYRVAPNDIAQSLGTPMAAPPIATAGHQPGLALALRDSKPSIKAPLDARNSRR